LKHWLLPSCHKNHWHLGTSHLLFFSWDK
jgi:hypothetical protein